MDACAQDSPVLPLLALAASDRSPTEGAFQTSFPLNSQTVQALKIQDQHLLVLRGRGRELMWVHFPAVMPTGRVVQVELGFGKLCLTITQERAEPVFPESSKAGALDMGAIHLGKVFDGEEALALSGRGLRSPSTKAVRNPSRNFKKAGTDQIWLATLQTVQPFAAPR